MDFYVGDGMTAVGRGEEETVVGDGVSTETFTPMVTSFSPL